MSAKQLVLESMQKHLANVKKKPLANRVDAHPRPAGARPAVVERTTQAAIAWARAEDAKEIERIEAMIRRQRGRIDADG